MSPAHTPGRRRRLPVPTVLAAGVLAAALVATRAVAADLPVRTHPWFGQTSGVIVPDPPLTRVSVNANQTCAVTTTRSVQCWGLNSSLQLGAGPTGNAVTPTRYLGEDGRPLRPANDVSMGRTQSCAVLLDGTVRCSGDRTSGRLGDGSSAGTATTRTVLQASDWTPLTGVRSVAAGADTCALLVAGRVRCWGAAVSLGNGATVDSPVAASPVLDATTGAPLEGVVSLSVGDAHACVVLVDGTARCWGSGSGGRLGNGGTSNSTTAVAVLAAAGGPALSGVRQVATGGSSCAAMADGTARCWGTGLVGQLGNGAKPGVSTVPTVVLAAAGVPLTGVAQVAVGDRHACATLTDGTVRCWGNGSNGKLGTGATTVSDQVYPVQARTADGPLTAARTVDAAANHTCAARIDETVWCWGYNGVGQLGDGTTTTRGYALPAGLLG